MGSKLKSNAVHSFFLAIVLASVTDLSKSFAKEIACFATRDTSFFLRDAMSRGWPDSSVVEANRALLE